MITLADRVKETSTTTGTGTLDLSGAQTGFQTFVAGAGDASEVYYVIAGQAGEVCAGEWETGIGTVTDATPDTLSRDTVLDSSTGAKINFSSGTKDVFLTVPSNGMAFSGAMVKRTTDQTITTGTTTKMAWDSEEYDVGGWHDNATNNSRLTVPAGVDRVRLSCFIEWEWSGGTGVRRVFTYLNNAVDRSGGGFETFLVATNVYPCMQTAVSGVIAVSAGDYFELGVKHEHGSDRNIEFAESWFAIEKVGP